MQKIRLTDGTEYLTKHIAESQRMNTKTGKQQSAVIFYIAGKSYQELREVFGSEGNTELIEVVSDEEIIQAYHDFTTLAAIYEDITEGTISITLMENSNTIEDEVRQIQEHLSEMQSGAGISSYPDVLILARMQAQNLEDEQALSVKGLFDEWDGNGVNYKAGYKLRYNDTLYKVLQDHTSQADWIPDVSLSLFAKVLIPDANVITEWEQPDSTNPYMTGDKVTHNSKTWVSDVDNNVWEPGEYGWTEVE